MWRLYSTTVAGGKFSSLIIKNMPVWAVAPEGKYRGDFLLIDENNVPQLYFGNFIDAYTWFLYAYDNITQVISIAKPAINTSALSVVRRGHVAIIDPPLSTIYLRITDEFVTQSKIIPRKVLTIEADGEAFHLNLDDYVVVVKGVEDGIVNIDWHWQDVAEGLLFRKNMPFKVLRFINGLLNSVPPLFHVSPEVSAVLTEE